MNDIEASIFISTLGLVKAKKNNYSEDSVDKNIVYVFNSYNEYKKFFIKNGFSYNKETNDFFEYEKNLIDNYIIKKTKKGTIIASKYSCDYIITKYNENNAKIKKLVK